MESGNANEELERKTQELYTASRNVERLAANVSHLELENESLKNALAEETKKFEEAKKEQTTSKNDEMLRQMIAELKQELEESQASEKALREENVRLEKRLEQVVTAGPNISLRTMEAEAEELAELEQKIADLQEGKIKLEAHVAEVRSQLERESSERSRLQQDLQEKDEEIECMESQFSTQCNISESLREEIQQLKAQLESKDGSVDENRKGNSLFSEVDDRRVAAEKKCVQVQQQMRSLQEKLTREMKENKRLKNQLAFARQMSKKGFDEDAVNRLQGQVLTGKKTIAELTEKLGKLESEQKRQTGIEGWKPGKNTTDDDKQFIDYLRGLIRSKTNELKDTCEEAKRLRLQNISVDLSLTEANHEITKLRHEVEQHKNRISHLNFSLTEMQHKYEDESETGLKLISTESLCSGKEGTTSTRSRLGGSTQETKPQSPLRNISNTSSTETVKPEQPRKTLKDIIRPSDLLGSPDTGNRENKGSKGVKMVSEVKVMDSEGAESTAELRSEGRDGKLRRARGASSTSKFKSITYSDATDTKPTECKQQ